MFYTEALKLWKILGELQQEESLYEYIMTTEINMTVTTITDRHFRMVKQTKNNINNQ